LDWRSSEKKKREACREGKKKPVRSGELDEHDLMPLPPEEKGGRGKRVEIYRVFNNLCGSEGADRY